VTKAQAEMTSRWYS